MINAQQMATALSQAASKLNTTTLAFKIQALRQNRSPDPIQQMQSEAIVELYDAVKQIQEAIWPMMALIPDVSGVRAAAAQAGAGSSTAATAVTAMPALKATAASTSRFRKP